MDPVEKGRSPKFGPVVKFTVAENVNRYNEKAKTFETVHTNWFQVTAFGTVAERAKDNLKKGSHVVVQGRMKISKFTDRAGEERTGFEILADEVALWKSLPAKGAATAGGDDGGDDLPF
jgi:single-strand DNA-binding protein